MVRQSVKKRQPEVAPFRVVIVPAIQTCCPPCLSCFGQRFTLKTWNLINPKVNWSHIVWNPNTLILKIIISKGGICALTHHLFSLHHSCTFASTHLDPMEESVCPLVCFFPYLFIYLLLIVCCMGVLSACMSVHNTYSMPTEIRRGHWIAWDHSYRQQWCRCGMSNWMKAESDLNSNNCCSLLPGSEVNLAIVLWSYLHDLSIMMN